MAGGGADAEALIGVAAYTIPANTIKAGTRVHFKATLRVTVGNTAGTLLARARLGGLVGQIVAVGAAADPGAKDGRRSREGGPE